MSPQRQRLFLAFACLMSTPVLCALDPAEWTLPRGFSIANYLPAGASVTNARSLHLSGASKRGGPWITYVGARGTGPQDVVALVDLRGRGQADYAQVILKGLSPSPNGIAWRNGSLFIASLDPGVSCKLYRLDDADGYALGRRAAPHAALRLVLDSLPPAGTHGWKFIRFGPDGRLYIPIGAPCNACRQSSYQKGPGAPVWRYGSIYSMRRNGGNITLVATGVRNTVGFDFHPSTGKLYFTDNGRDSWDADQNVTDNRPDCELNVVTQPGQFFGFPFCHTGPVGGVNRTPYLRLPGIGPNLVDPETNPGEAETRCNGAGLAFRPAIQAMGPHVAPLGMRFYRWSAGANFPQSYDKSILIAQHGSWNRNRLIGARVMRVVLNSTDPTRVVRYVPFLTGGVPGDKGLAAGPGPGSDENYIGRPVDVQQLPDGSLLVSDNLAAAVYRIWYTAASPAPARPPPPPPPRPRPASCTLRGVQYAACSTVTLGGVPFSQYYKMEGGLLHVGIKARTSGWAAWSYNAKAPGSMVGARAFFLRPCPSCSGGVSTPAFLLAGRSTSQFTPLAGTFTRQAAGATANGQLWAVFSLAWPGAAAAIKINYGVGAYSGGSPSGADGMRAHDVGPPRVCVARSGGGVAIRPSSAC